MGKEFTTSLENLLNTEWSEDDKKTIYLKMKPKPTDVSHILPSGETTGLPKGIPRTHNDYIRKNERG